MRKRKIIVGLILVCLLAGSVTVIAVVVHNNSEASRRGGTMSGDMNPALMYNGNIYDWKHMSATAQNQPKGELPSGYQYVGDIQYVDKQTPEKDLQFVAGFKATGQIYANKDQPQNVCVCITTDWLDQSYVIFSQ